MLFYLIAEGSTDEPIIKRALTTFFDTKIEIRLIEPQYDATTRRHDSFGYEGVLNWCKRCCAEKAKTIRASIGLAAERPIAVLIQMDADIAHHISRSGDTFTEGTDRVEWIRSALTKILEGIKLQVPMVFVIPKMQSETWLLASYDDETLQELKVDPLDIENHIPVETTLIALGYEKHPEEEHKLLKAKRLYEHDPLYAPRITTYSARIADRCPQYAAFRDAVKAL